MSGTKEQIREELTVLKAEAVVNPKDEYYRGVVDSIEITQQVGRSQFNFEGKAYPSSTPEKVTLDPLN